MVYSAAIKNKQRVILFGEHEQSDIRLISYDNVTQVATLSRYGGPQENMKIGAAGHHMALNSLAVIAVTTALDYPLAPILERLKTFRPLPAVERKN